MAITIDDHSRLQFAQLSSQDGVTFWDGLDLPDIVVQTDDVQYMTMNSDRIDRIANQFYGDPVLWWVIAAANDMELLPNALYGGQTLRIPSPRYVLQELFKNAINQS